MIERHMMSVFSMLRWPVVRRTLLGISLPGGGVVVPNNGNPHPLHMPESTPYNNQHCKNNV